jgi:TPR repeat protein
MQGIFIHLSRIFSRRCRPFFGQIVKNACLGAIGLLGLAWVPAQAASATLDHTKPFTISLPTESSRPPLADRAYQHALKEYHLGHHQEAVRLWKLSAAEGDSQSQFALGALYAEGDTLAGEAPDYVQAMSWYRKAADQGHAAAQFNLGIFYASGQAVSRDLAEAARWWQPAALQGHVEAQFNLGLLYAQGSGVDIDLREAAKWWDMAAKQGYAAAQFNLGVMYVKGQGVNEDPTEAVRLWQLSARQGFGQAIDVLKNLQINP